MSLRPSIMRRSLRRPHKLRGCRRRRTGNLEMNDTGIVALALRVTGVETLVGRVEAAGYHLLSGIVEQTLPDGAILKVAVCIGPDRIKVIMVEPPKGRKSLSG
jgi:hypothetical protein